MMDNENNEGYCLHLKSGFTQGTPGRCSATIWRDGWEGREAGAGSARGDTGPRGACGRFRPIHGKNRHDIIKQPSSD